MLMTATTVRRLICLDDRHVVTLAVLGFRLEMAAATPFLLSLL